MDDEEPVSRIVHDALIRLSKDIRDFNISSVSIIRNTLSSLEFLRDYVSSNKPVVIDNGCLSNWNALHRWLSDDYLCQTAGNCQVTVALTPHGRADCPVHLPTEHISTTEGIQELPNDRECFALPYQEKMTLTDFFSLLKRSTLSQTAAVPYLQFQNDSLRTELPCLLSDIDENGLQWASDAFDSLPDATNIWIGSNRSITSWHKDHYENIYVVIRGRKIFKLFPPADVFRMQLTKYPVATYQFQSQCDKKEAADLVPVLHSPREETLWSSILPGNISSHMHDAESPIIVTLEPGQILYLPSCWWHEVHNAADNNETTIAVNFWFDMKFDASYAHYTFVERLAVVLGLNESM